MLKMRLLCCLVLCLFQLDYVTSHGSLVYPYIWLDAWMEVTNKKFIANGEVFDNPGIFKMSGSNINKHNKARCGHLKGIKAKINSECYIQKDMPNKGTNKEQCTSKERNVAWFTNGPGVGSKYEDFMDPKYWCSKHNPKKCLIPEDMIDGPVTKKTEFGRTTHIYRHPWLAPGRANNFSPCGCGGGHCNYKEDGSQGRCDCYEPRPGEKGTDDDFTPASGKPQRGTSCRHGCEAYCFGDLLEKIYPRLEDEKLEKTPVTTVWKSGGTADVVWYVGANHWGGYSYRLCNLAKIGGDRTKLTEDCFNGQLGKDFGGPLEFSGDKQWIKSINKDCLKESNWSSDKWMEVSAKRTKTGTFPEGSQWTKNPFVPGFQKKDTAKKDLCVKEVKFAPRQGGAKLTETGESVPCVCAGSGYIYDKVKVPADLMKGEYVLSFRWDAEKSAQVWNMCANIRIE